MNQSVSCEVCVFELQQWNASIGLIKVLLKSKLKTVYKTWSPGPWTTPVDHPRVVRKFWSRRLICQSKQPALGRRHCQAPKAQASWGGLGTCSPGKFLHLDALKCCFLHSPGYFLSIITKNPENKLCSLSSNLVREWWYFILKMPPVKKCQAE